jgi:effector-binding domain-containing protein
VEPVRVEVAGPRNLAAVSRTSATGRLGADIMAALDLIWPELRRAGVATGLNVVLYHGGPELIEVGVEVPAGFVPSGNLKTVRTPAGEVAAAAHFGDYSGLSAAYDSLEAWRRQAHREFARVSWEVYGHWTDNPDELRTDVYFLLAPVPGS